MPVPAGVAATDVLDRILEAAEFLGWSGRQLAREADVSASQISVAKFRGGDLKWSTLEALVTTPHQRGFRRDWILFGEEPKLAAVVEDEPLPPPIRRRQKPR